MAGIREYQFDSGFHTSQAPDTAEPSDADDVVTKGYAEDNFTSIESVGNNIDDITALKAIVSADRFDNQLRFINDLDTWYQFDAGSSATPDDDLVVQPNSGTGRWLKASSSGTGAAGGTNAEQLMQKLESERSNVYTEMYDNAQGISGQKEQPARAIVGELMADAASGQNQIVVGYNLLPMNGSDANIDSTTNWSAVGAGTSLTTNSSTKKVGANSLQFDKDSSATEAGIRYDQGSQIKNFGINYKHWFFIYLPSITGLSNVFLKIYADSTSNYRTWTTSTDAYGNSLAIGWNLIHVNVSTGGTASGSGWTYAQLSRYQHIGVTTSSSGQTYTGVLVDSYYASLGDIEAYLNAIGNRFTLFNNSIQEQVTVAVSNTRSDGLLTLSANLTNNHTGGNSGASRSQFLRSVLKGGDGAIGFDSTLSSGTIATSQVLRIGKVLRESLSGSYSSFADIRTAQMYTVVAGGSTTFTVDDPSDTDADLLSSDVVHAFKRYIHEGEAYYSYLGDITLTSNSSTTSSVMTITSTSGSSIIGQLATGDMVVKKHLTSAFSATSYSAVENFSSLTPDASPDGIQVVGGYSRYENPESIIAHWALAGSSDLEALRNRKGLSLGALTKTGTLNLQDSFLSGRKSSSGYSSGNYLSIGGTSELQNSGRLQCSFWMYYDGNTTGTDRGIIGAGNASTQGWWIYIVANEHRLEINMDSATTTIGTPLRTGWNHVVFHRLSSTKTYGYLNGIRGTIDTGSSITATNNFVIGAVSNSASKNATNVKIADLIVWHGGSEFTANQVYRMYNGGNYQDSLRQQDLRYLFTANGQTGQKVSQEFTLSRSTTAIQPQIMKAGFIKTG